MTLLKSSLAILVLTIISCCTSSKSAGEESSNSLSKEELSITAAKMMDSGYQRATVVVSTVEGDCPVTLQMDGDTTAFLDPINIYDIDAAFRVHGTKVWVTYNGLRMMNRCVKANPISIVDMQKRAE